MTLAKYQGRGCSYSVTGRCADRRMGLIPSTKVFEAVRFSLARAVHMYALEVHLVMVMGNHIHLEVTDRHGNLSKMMCLFKSLVARALNCARGSWEYFWGPTRKSTMLVTTYADAVARFAYDLVNPVAAGMVSTCEAWPGWSTKPADLLTIADGGLTVVVDKPDFFFRKEKDGGQIPDQLTLTFTPHPLAGDDPKKFAEDVIAEVNTLVARAHREAKRKRRRFKGAARVRRMKWHFRAASKAKRRSLIPAFVAKDMVRRLALMRGYADWLKAYTKARLRWLKTGRAAFPAGTNAMRGLPGVTVRAGPVLWIATLTPG